jgi:peroxiredoxin
MSLAADQVPASPDQVCPKLVGQAVPQLVLTGEDGASFDLNAAIRQKPTVLVFYRGGW